LAVLYDTDVDECAMNNGGCSPHAYCTNTPGNFTCTCIEGYFGDGFNCSGNTPLHKLNKSSAANAIAAAAAATTNTNTTRPTCYVLPLLVFLSTA